jgi:precorrin-6B methylase 2
MTQSNVDYPSLISSSKKYLNQFGCLIKDITYERKGILYSEMFFLYLAAMHIKPDRILESGRARGQSTLILSKIFPTAEIISIEYDQKSEDVKIANQRLSKCKNVKLLFGDASILLPKILKNGKNDIVLIDGPKGYKAIRLAINILKHKNVKQIFIHDTSPQTKERLFLEKYLPDIIYSDYFQLAKITHFLDKTKKIQLSSQFQFKPQKPYGFSLALIQNNSSRNHALLILHSRLIQFTERISKKICLMF